MREALQLPKKLGRRPHIMAAASCTPTPVGFHVRDKISGRKLLVDTGAMQSTFPPTAMDRDQHDTTTPALVAANGTPIKCYGVKTLDISILGHTYSWPFIIADVKMPLLGADFLAHHELLVDVANRRLLDIKTYKSLPLTTGPAMPLVCSATLNEYGALLQEFPEVFKPELRQQPGTPNKHGIFHYIKTTGPPTHAKFRRLPPKKLQDAKLAFSEMERMGICKKAASPWASPLHMVKKPDGSWRPCGDYRRLNLVTEPDHYPLPNMQDLTGSLHGAKVF